MRINIAQRFLPYCHEAGLACLLPGNHLWAKVYPTYIEVYPLHDWSMAPPSVVEIDVAGPVTKFTGLLDLERQGLQVWGQGSQGYFRYIVRPTADEKISWHLQRNPGKTLQAHGPALAPAEATPLPPPPARERLALGCHKAQEWSAIRRRSLLAQWLPLWHWIAQSYPVPSTFTPLLEDTSQLGHLTQAYQQQRSDLLAPLLQNLYQSSFTDFFVPSQHQWRLLGHSHPPTNQPHPLTVLTSGGAIIRSLFLQTSPHSLHLLPLLPHELHCGRYLHASCGPNVHVDFEWSKHFLRRVIIYSLQDTLLTIQWPRELKKCRLRTRLNSSHGSVLSNGSSITLAKDTRYYLDRFEK